MPENPARFSLAGRVMSFPHRNSRSAQRPVVDSLAIPSIGFF